MNANRRTLIVTAFTASFVAAAAVLPAGAGFAAERAATPTLPYEMDAIAPPSPDEQAATERTALETDGAEQRCMAKVVHHEARNQSRSGMLAVAQTLVNRMKAGGRFGDTICAVANQRGQYFDTKSYHPREDSEDWQTAMAVAHDALSGDTTEVASGALFFRAAYAPPTSFFRSRQRIAAVGDHIFYR